MRILQLCKKFPYPLNDGESIAVTFFAKALRDLGHEVTLLSMNTAKHFFDLKQLPEDFDHYNRIETSYLDNSVSHFKVLANLFSNKSFHVARFDTEDFRQKLIRLIKQQEYDLVFLETIILAPYINDIRRHSTAKIAMRAHNVEHEIWENVAKNSTSIVKKVVLNQAASRLKKFEMSIMNEVDLFVAISKTDLIKFSELGLTQTSTVVPIGVDETMYRRNDRSFDRPLSISFIGSLDWIPNVEGLLWFIDKAWPVIHQHHPELTFHIAGKKSPPSILNLNQQNIHPLGEVECAPTFINKHSIMVVPLLSGSGMRAKIIEGMMLGKVIITTSLGLKGIEAIDGKHILIADTPEQFVRQIQYCHDHPNRVREMGEAAYQYARQQFSNHAIAKNFVETISKKSMVSV